MNIGSFPLTGLFRPSGDMSLFRGKNPIGTWQLIAGDSSNGDPLCIYAIRIALKVRKFEIDPGPDFKVLEGETTDLNANVNGINVRNIEWRDKITNAIISTDENPAPFIHTLTNSSNNAFQDVFYTISGTDDLGNGCTVTEEVKVTYERLPNITLSSTVNSCESESTGSINLTYPTNTNGASIIEFSKDGGATYSSSSTVASGAFSFTGLPSANYHVKARWSGSTFEKNLGIIEITSIADNTAAVPSTTPTLCIDTVLTDITIGTNGATGIGTPTGLPAGVTAAWAGNVITITGTPTASGVFNYSIPLTGGCGTVNATGTITVTATGTSNTAASPSTTPTLCIDTMLTDITIGTNGATGIGTPTGLPAGVTAAWAGNVITITGTPTASGVFNYSIPLTGGCGTVNATGTITVTADNTAAAPSTTPTLCIDTVLTDITIGTNGATGIGTPTGLPAGVTAAWAGNVITITGTPIASGAFNYSIPLTGGCGTVNATGTITVTADNTAAAPSTTPTLCIDTVLTDITIGTNGATGIGTPTGLPAGVTAAWAGNVITITGTPTASGVFNYSIPLTGGCGTVNATGTITVTADNTAAAPSTTPTLCIDTVLTDITIETNGATGIGAPTGLPAGVTAAWAGNVITITGTPTASGGFFYSIPLTGGCGTVNATGTITVTATGTSNTAAAPSTTPTLCIDTVLTDITIGTNGATGIRAPTGLPAGVTAAWAGNVITITGTPT